ncbi:MAG: TlpA family protein disulfide reductase [Lachnospiraceae bacterium]|nr:TlpA family protein disulfide reductase [Lachnospiraceae bacterium]
MKKRTILFLSVILALGCLCGCMSDSDNVVGNASDELLAETDDEQEDTWEDSEDDSEDDYEDDSEDTQEDDEDVPEDETEEWQEDEEDVATADDDKDYSNTFLQFTLEDLDHNSVSMKDLISPNKVTILNFWGTFCGPCINEMPELGKLERKYKDQGIEIIGVTGDLIDLNGNVDEGLIDDARDIVQQTGVTYPILIPTSEIMNYAQLEAYPTTFFVNADGELLTDPIVGSYSGSDWEQMIQEMLED